MVKAAQSSVISVDRRYLSVIGPRQWVEDKDQDRDSNVQDKDQESENTASRRLETKQCLEASYHWIFVKSIDLQWTNRLSWSSQNGVDRRFVD